jgi:uncharacterized protein
VHRAHQAGLAGASVLRGIEGYGASSRIHTTRPLPLTEDRIRAFPPQLDELITEELAIIDPIDVIRYIGRAPAPI